MPRLSVSRERQTVVQQGCGYACDQACECAVAGDAFEESAEHEHSKQGNIHYREDQQYRIEQAVETDGGAGRRECKQHAARSRESGDGKQALVG